MSRQTPWLNHKQYVSKQYSSQPFEPKINGGASRIWFDIVELSGKAGGGVEGMLHLSIETARR
jgi:hypothetical protein